MPTVELFVNRKIEWFENGGPQDAYIAKDCLIRGWDDPLKGELGLASHYLLTSYRVSSKRVYAFVFQISRPPRGLEIPSWTIFNSPFYVDFLLTGRQLKKSVREVICLGSIFLG